MANTVFLYSGDGARFQVPTYIAAHSKTIECMLDQTAGTLVTQLHFPELTGSGLENKNLNLITTQAIQFLFYKAQNRYPIGAIPPFKFDDTHAAEVMRAADVLDL